jgi:voltage-gated potassium channel
MALMLLGIGTVLYTLGVVVAFFIEGSMAQLLGRRRHMRTISHLKNHIIVVGYGRMGQALGLLPEN